ncbi:hypothetical protein BC629DRAFT_578024 [Irpex lacteus]|nr:hypothetical protein BC629DRAFT_578024 [Irpex lacteus]
MSDFEGSDLTDLEDETWTQNTSASQKKKKQTDSDGYRIRGALKAPRSTTISARHLLEQLHENDIDLDAEYQRDVVWPITKQMGLIDSMFRNFYIPPVIFSVNEAPDGSVKRVCIDGKQRLTSIWRFMEGLIPHKDPFTSEKYFFKDIPDRREKGKLLPERYRKIFENKQIVCMEYADLTDSNEREVFQRVQLGMALTPAEKLQAIHSDAGVFLHSLQSEYVTERLAEHLDWDVARAADFRCLATAIYLIEKGGTSMAAPGITTLHKWLEEADAFSDATSASLHQTFQIFVWLSEDKQCSKCFNLEKDRKKLKVSPLEFIASAVLINTYKSKLTLKQLSEAIRNMRNDVRSVEQDIRLNTRCVRIVMTFIKGLKASSMKSDPDNPVATVAIKKLFKPKTKVDEDSEEEEQTKTPAKKPVVKRKREDSDDEWQPQKASSSQRTTRQSPVKRSPPSAVNGHTESARTSASTSALPARPPSPPFSAPPLPSPSLPPPPPPEPRVHPDRLAALRNAKIGVPVPVYQSPYANGQPGPNDPPYPSPNSQYAPYPPPRWQEQPPMRLGPLTPAADVGPPPYGSDPQAPLQSSQRPGPYGREDYDRDRGYNRYSNSRYSR